MPAGLVQGVREDDLRRARISWLDDTGPAAWAFERVVGAVIDANRAMFDFALDGFDERMQIAWYGATNAGHFDWHMDIGDGRLAQRRKLTFVAQLSASEGYSGGDLQLNSGGASREVGRALGSAVLFPSFILHRVTPVLTGERYSLTLWVHGPAFR